MCIHPLFITKIVLIFKNTGQFNLVFSPTKIHWVSGTVPSPKDKEMPKWSLPSWSSWSSSVLLKLSCASKSPGSVVYWLFLYNNSPQNPAAENNKHLSFNIVAESQELRSDSAGWVWLWVFTGCRLDVGCSYVIWSLDQGWGFTSEMLCNMIVGRGPQFLAMWPSPQINCLSVLTTRQRQLWLPQGGDPRERSFMT